MKNNVLISAVAGCCRLVALSALLFAGPFGCSDDNGGGNDNVNVDIDACVPDCSGRVCGPDPLCGESCGECTQEGDECSPEGLCVCAPLCDHRICGTDPRCLESCGNCDQVVIANPGFEMEFLSGADRPPYWYLGFPDEPLPPSSGSWSIVSDEVAEGSQSLRLRPTGQMSAVQILHLPASLLSGRTVGVTVSIRHEGMDQPPDFVLAAFNPELPDMLAGLAYRNADAEEGVWKDYHASFTGSDQALAVFVSLDASSMGGTAWFDDIRVQADPWSPGSGPDPASVDIPIFTRNFETGFVLDVAMDLSEVGSEHMVDKTEEAGSVANLFFHVCWCAITGESFEDHPPHKARLAQADRAKELGLELVLTLDFTHDSPDSVGDLNPKPDGTPAGDGTLLDPLVREAYESELLWLFDRIEPRYVMVGIEMNIMHDLHPDWWDAYREMLADVYESVKLRNPSTHVTAYHTLDWTVDSQGDLRQDNADIWRQLRPYIDSIAFSTYPNASLHGMPTNQYPAGYFSRPAEIDPSLPIFVPEFGMAGGGSSGFSEAEQAWVLRRMLSELAAANPVALIWYQAYDMLYLGAPITFQQWFDHEGMHSLDGTPKESYVIWKKVRALLPADPP